MRKKRLQFSSSKEPIQVPDDSVEPSPPNPEPQNPETPLRVYDEDDSDNIPLAQRSSSQGNSGKQTMEPVTAESVKKKAKVSEDDDFRGVYLKTDLEKVYWRNLTAPGRELRVPSSSTYQHCNPWDSITLCIGYWRRQDCGTWLSNMWNLTLL